MYHNTQLPKIQQSVYWPNTSTQPSSIIRTSYLLHYHGGKTRTQQNIYSIAIRNKIFFSFMYCTLFPQVHISSVQIQGYDYFSPHKKQYTETMQCRRHKMNTELKVKIYFSRKIIKIIRILWKNGLLESLLPFKNQRNNKI